MILSAGWFTGCATYTLRMKATVLPKDSSAVSPRLATSKIGKIMILPPSGTKRGEFDTQVSAFEKELIKQGLTPISGAITGRVVLEESTDKEKKTEAAQNLSDMERALIMAKKSGADAILQIGQFDWLPLDETRYFIQDTNNAYTEVDRGAYQAWAGIKQSFLSPWLKFVGRLAEVTSGEVVASFDVQSAPNWNLPADYEASYSGDGVRQSENFDYGGMVWQDAKISHHKKLPVRDLNLRRNLEARGLKFEFGGWYTEAMNQTIQKVIAAVAKNIASGNK